MGDIQNGRPEAGADGDMQNGVTGEMQTPGLFGDITNPPLSLFGEIPNPPLLGSAAFGEILTPPGAEAAPGEILIPPGASLGGVIHNPGEPFG